AKDIKEKLKHHITTINDVRVDINHIEVDLFSNDVNDPNKISSDLNEKIIETVNIDAEINSDYKLYLMQRRFWEAHESLEKHWKNEKNQKIKDSIRLSIQFCAAMVHYQKCNDNIAKEIFKRAISIDSDIKLVRDIIGIDLNSINSVDLNFESIIDQMMKQNH
ncbi:MAG: DUF309 domain-containing protein, partial [Conexivisphaerales archaeon]